MNVSTDPGGDRGTLRTDDGSSAWPEKLWLYTNFDCNIRCSYCVAESTPRAQRRALGLANVRQLVDEAVVLGFNHVFFTGGEPFILDEIYDMLAYSSARIETTVLTNAMLLRGKRMDRLCAIANGDLSVQVSLDGARPEHHDAYRGQGTWAKTIEGIRLLQSHGLHVCISTTQTPANSAHLDELDQFLGTMGICEKDHFVRPLARRGFSQQGLEVSKDSLLPEVTVTIDGVFWHPLVSPSDDSMRVSREIFPLQNAVEAILKQVKAHESTGDTARSEFT